MEELVEREDGVGDDKRDEEEEADSKEASSITRQKRPEAKKSNERLVRGVNGLYKRRGGKKKKEKKEREKEKRKNRKPLPKERGNGEGGGAEWRVKLDKERLPL